MQGFHPVVQLPLALLHRLLPPGSAVQGGQLFVSVTSSIRGGRAAHRKVIKSLSMPGHPVLQQSAVWAGAQSAEQGLERSRRGSGLCDCLVAGEFLHPPQQHHHLHLCFTALVAGPLALILYGCYQMQSYYLKTQRECIWLGSITKSPIVSGFTSAIRGVGTIRA